MKNIKCCFIGHRKINYTHELESKIKDIVEDLIIKKDVNVFLFGSRSEFNYLCHKIVTELKLKYPYIKRIFYTCKSEGCTIESERKHLEEIYSHIKKQKINLLGFEEEFEHKTKYTSGKASYVERNQAMIDDSDYCIFYYDKHYQPKLRKASKLSSSYYQPKSGTALANNYAKQKNKNIINTI